MKRGERRRILKAWRKLPCFSDCTDRVTIAGLPNTAVEFLFKFSEDLMLRYNLDMFNRWRLFPVVVVDGFFWQGYGCDVGVASDWWLEMYFGNDDKDFGF